MNGYEKMTHFFCSSCYKSKEKSAFMISLNPSHNKYFPCCRTCLSAKFKKYKTVTESDGAALYCLCAELGYPMIQEIWNMTEKIVYDRTKDGKSPDVFICYHNTLKEIGYQVEGFWQSDMDFSDFMKSQQKKCEEEKPVELNLAQEEKIWGKFAAEEYELLNEFFEMYTQDLLNMDTAMELRYRDL